MPEGDTVWRAARALDDGLSGRTLTRTDFRVPSLATTDLAGAAVVGTASRGKHLLTRLARDGNEWTIHSHLTMEGAWKVLARGDRWPRPAHRARVVLESDDLQAVGFALGVLELLPTAEEERVVGHLGPDLLGPDWDPVEAARRLATDPSRPVHEALLDQRNLAGIGNMYAAELCFLVGRPPTSAVSSVDLERLVGLAHRVLAQNRLRAVQATTGDLHRGRRHWVYRREGQPCLRCGTVIRVATGGPPGRERATYWCPACQPE